MTQAIFAKSGLSITGDEIYQILNGRIRAIQADTSNNQVVVYLEKKDNSGDTNASTTEVLTFDADSGNEATAAEDIIKAINGLAKHAQNVKISDIPSRSVNGVNGVQIPVFTIANTDVAISATAEDDFTFTLGSATVGCTFSAVLTMNDDSHTFTETGTIATASDTIQFDSTSFSAGAATLVVTLTNPNQPNVTRVVSKAATITS